MFELGVGNSAINYFLGISETHSDSFSIFMPNYKKYLLKEIRTALVLLETLFGTAYELEIKQHISINLNFLAGNLEDYFIRLLANEDYIEILKQELQFKLAEDK
ncbi:hypothetical protein ACI6BU_19885 [Lysinibacillus boronitolerans]